MWSRAANRLKWSATNRRAQGAADVGHDRGNMSIIPHTFCAPGPEKLNSEIGAYAASETTLLWAISARDWRNC